MNTYSTKDTPTIDEVTAYFNEKGIAAEYASLWYTSMQGKKWKNAQGKRIVNWQLYANYKINDLREKHQIDTKSTALNKTLYELAEGITEIQQQRTQRIFPHMCKLYYELISVFKYNRSLTEQQTVQCVHKALKRVLEEEEKIGFDFNYLYNNLETSLFSL